uniref:flagellin n=1 Tax=Anaerobiospirillum succiniciproducens TaxID=13335 RepID=UPI00248E1579
SDGIALAQTIESGMDEISGMLQKIRTLSVQAANGTNTAEDRTALAKEATALVNEMARIANQTTYGGKTVLQGGTSTSIYTKSQTPSKGAKMTLQVGSNKGDTITFDVASFVFSHMAKDAGVATKAFASLKGASQAVKFSAASAAQLMIDNMDKLIAKVDAQRAYLGAIQTRLESSIRNRIRDADFAEESANLTQQNIIQQAAASMLMQANSRPQLGLSLLG